MTENITRHETRTSQIVWIKLFCVCTCMCLPRHVTDWIILRTEYYFICISNPSVLFVQKWFWWGKANGNSSILIGGRMCSTNSVPLPKPDWDFWKLELCMSHQEIWDTNWSLKGATHQNLAYNNLFPPLTKVLQYSSKSGNRLCTGLNKDHKG